MACIFSVAEKEFLHTVHKNRQQIFIGYSITVSKLACIFTEGGVCYSQSFVKFVCLILKSYTQFESTFHVVFSNVALVVDCRRQC